MAISSTHQQRWLRSLRRGLAPAAMLVRSNRCQSLSLNGASIPSLLGVQTFSFFSSMGAAYLHTRLTHPPASFLFTRKLAFSTWHSRTSVCTPHSSVSVVAVLVSVGVGAVDGARIYMLGEQVQAREASQLYNDAAVCNSHVVVGSTE